MNRRQFLIAGSISLANLFSKYQNLFANRKIKNNLKIKNLLNADIM